MVERYKIWLEGGEDWSFEGERPYGPGDDNIVPFELVLASDYDALAAELAGAIQAGADVARRCAKAWDQNVKLTERIFVLEAALREARAWIEEDTDALRQCHMPYNDTDPIDQDVRAEVDARLAWLRSTAETKDEDAKLSENVTGFLEHAEKHGLIFEEQLQVMAIPITFTDPAYVLFDTEQNAVMTTQYGNLAIFSTKGMAEVLASRSAKKVEVREVRIKPTHN